MINSPRVEIIPEPSDWGFSIVSEFLPETVSIREITDSAVMFESTGGGLGVGSEGGVVGVVYGINEGCEETTVTIWTSGVSESPNVTFLVNSNLDISSLKITATQSFCTALTSGQTLAMFKVRFVLSIWILKRPSGRFVKCTDSFFAGTELRESTA